MDDFSPDELEAAVSVVEPPLHVEPGTLLYDGRFQIQELLGSGSFGSVYQAYDHARQHAVAIKILRRNTPDSVSRLKREFRILADIKHRNLIPLYQLISDRDLWFITMELIHGVSFVQYVRQPIDPAEVMRIADSDPATLQSGEMSLDPPEPGARIDVPLESGGDDCSTLETARRVTVEGPASSPTVERPYHRRQSGACRPTRTDLARLRRSLLQLAQGLVALHTEGKLHRDIKPANVLACEDGRIVLLDFGMARDFIAEPSDPVGWAYLAGTPAYMSPEQADALPLTEASDWYSVGVLLFEALTRRLPFEGRARQVLREKRLHDGPRPSDFAADVPQDLDDFCAALLKRQPEDRPTGEEVLKLLGGASPRTTSRRPGTISQEFVGRKAALRLLADAEASMDRGNTVMVRIDGRSGIGKSRLVRKFLEEERQRDSGAIILSCKCYERESISFKAFDSLVDELVRYLERLPEPSQLEVVPEDVSCLARLFPVTLQLEVVARAFAAATPVTDPQEVKRRGLAAFRSLISRLAARRRIILFIDDLQWGDPDSALFLAELLAPAEPVRILFIVAYRSEDVAASPLIDRLDRLLERLGTSLSCIEIHIDEMSLEEARTLAHALIDPLHPDRDSLADIIAQESGGSPFFVGELVQFASAAPDPVPSPGGDTPDRRMLPNLEVVVGTRIQSLPTVARTMLELVAVAAQPLGVDELCTAAGLEGDPYTPLSMLRNQRLIRTHGISDWDVVESYHDRIREAVQKHLAPPVLRERHGRLAAALEAKGRRDAETLVMHYLAAGQRGDAARWILPAAEVAAAALAFEGAARLYRMALDLVSEDQAPRASLFEKLGAALANAGHSIEAATAYRRAAESLDPASDGRISLKLREKSALQYLLSGHPSEGIEMLTTVLDITGVKLARTPMHAVASILWHRFLIRLRGMRSELRDEASIPAQELLKLDVCATVAQGLGLIDVIRGLDYITRSLYQALRVGEPRRLVIALAQEAANLSARTGGAAEANTLLRIAHEVIVRTDEPYVHARLAICESQTAVHSGDWHPSLSHCATALEHLRRCESGEDLHFVAAKLHFYHFGTLYYLGRIGELCSRLPAILHDSEQRGDLWTLALFGGRHAVTERLAQDRADDARGSAERARRIWPVEGFHIQHLFALVGGAEAELYAGEPGVAWQLVSSRWPAFRRSRLWNAAQHLMIEATYLHGRCCIAMAQSTGDRAQRKALIGAARKGAADLRKSRPRWSRCAADALEAGIASISQRPEDAVSLLNRAETGYLALGMLLHAHCARRARGVLLGGDEGRALVEQSDGWMSGQSIVTPGSFAGMLSPGSWTAV